ncbi:MAG: zinc-dependent alcohol dehydrogenase, partial [Micromonosporaceae bacterium]
MRVSKAAVLVGPRAIEVQEFPRPPAGDMDGWLKVDACGVCASDLPLWRGEVRGELPVVLGHEIAGTVDDLGDGARARWGVSEGDRVILERWIPCGHCELCYTGRYRMCKPLVDGHRRFYGGAPTALAPALWGGFAEHVYLSEDTVLYPVSPDVPAHYLPLFTPLANSISWLQQAGVRPGSTVLIQGPGQEGLCAVIAAAQLGADHITVIGLPRDRIRLDIAKRLGAR